MRVNREKLRALREQYPFGTVVELIRMDDKQAPPAGTRGVVTHVDDMGTVHTNWATGSRLGLIPDVDEFRVIKTGGAV
ncbi:MAG: DUF4314 domain-containing protein [Mogibacterium sp.]|nr:DUF4314 domain-containing protein [Mogibacterium sp.]